MDADPVGIATRLVTGGDWERASVVLDEVEKPPKGKEAQFFKLKGIVALNLNQNEQAVEAFGDAIEAGGEPITYLFRAQAKMGLEDYSGVLSDLDQAGDAAEGIAGGWQLRARALRNLKRFDQSYTALLGGRERFPEHPGLVDDQLNMLVDLGLTQEALELGTEMLPKVGAPVTTWVAMGDRIRQAGALDEALVWLEDTHVRFPQSIDAKVALASACLEAEQPLCCGEMLQEAAAFDNKFASEAAECFRRAGQVERAVYQNATVVEDGIKVRQRLGLLLEQRNFSQAAALDSRLSRLGVLRDDEQVTYALAYAHFENGSYARADKLLRGIRDPAIFRQATKLREAMQEAQSSGAP